MPSAVILTAIGFHFNVTFILFIYYENAFNHNYFSYRSFSIISTQQVQVSKIKYEKVMRWRLEFMNVNLEIGYGPSKENFPAIALLRCTTVHLAFYMKYITAYVKQESQQC